MKRSESLLPVAMVGIGGYGTGLLRTLIEGGAGHGLRVVAAVDPMPERAPMTMAMLADAGVPCYAKCEDIPAAPAVQLAVIASPIPVHASQTCLLLSRGIHVLCEKPAAATLEDGLAMAKAARAAGRQCAIGFQWSFASSTRRLKMALASGSLGAPRSISVMTLWPRGRGYYARNGWAGRRYDAAGRAVFDDPVMNATSHFLHHSLFILGEAPTVSAWPVSVEAELYRARPIETFDAAALRLRTAGGVTIRFLTAHCCRDILGPLFSIHCDEADVEYNWERGTGPGFIVHRPDGSQEILGQPEAESQEKLWRTVAAVRAGTPVDCPVEAALPHLAVAQALRQLPVQEIPPSVCTEYGEAEAAVPVPEGLDEVFIRAHKNGLLPHEAGGATWTVPAVAAPDVAGAP
jgi:predicted dehydrogenase